MNRIPWPKSLLARNFLLLMALTLALEFSIFGIFYNLVQRPRAEGLAGLIASQINTQQSLLSHMSESQRDAAIARINSEGLLQIDRAGGNSHNDPEQARGGLWLKDFIDQLKLQLPAGSLPMVSKDGHALVRARLGKDMYWFSLPLHTELRNRAMTVASLTSALVASMCLLTAWVIQRRINRPLRKLQRAARAVESGRAPEHLAEAGPAELSAVTRQFNRMAESLTRNDSMRATMLAGISHDIRTPLARLRLALALGPLDEKAASVYIGQIDHILGKFLDFGRIDIDEATSPVEANTLVRQLAAEFEEAGQSFELRLDPAIGVTPLRAMSLHRALSNLMENAVRYGKSGLSVSTRLQDGLLSITVSDSGPGIPADEIENLRRPFTRADAARSSSGTGLGLAIVDRMAQANGGKLVIGIREGGGLQAMLCIPVPLASG